MQDTVFDYDSVPIPQGLIAEPGGNIVGAQLGTTGVSATTLALGGYTDQSQNALGGVVNEIPAMGTYPARATFEIAGGLGAQYGEVKIGEQWATPDLRWRYALSSEQGDAYFAYGNGVVLGIAIRGQFYRNPDGANWTLSGRFTLTWGEALLPPVWTFSGRS